MDEELVFEDLAPKEFPVKIGNRRFVLVEAMADVEIKYLDCGSKEAKLDPNTKTVKVGAIHKAEPLAVSLCLFELKVMGNAQEKRIPVTLDTVLKWRPVVYQQLFAKLCEMSPGLSAKNPARTKEQEKNLPSNGEDTSASADI